MQANRGRKRSQTQVWKRNRKLLLQNGQLSRYKIGTLPQTSSRSLNSPVDLPFRSLLPVDEVEDERQQAVCTVDKLHGGTLTRLGCSHGGPSMKIHIGGLRGDPFESYPIKSGTIVQHAFDYCQLSRLCFKTG
jgi:hypothetical protein